MPVNIEAAQFQVPVTTGSPMYSPVERVGVDKLTSGAVNGTGVFDKLMASVNAHIKQEFDKGRITGASYTEAYIALTQSAMSTALQFLLSQEQTFWQSQQAQIASVNGLVRLETDRVSHDAAVFAAETAEQQALAAAYNVEVTLPLQTDLAEIQRDTAQYNLDNMLPLITAEQNYKNQIAAVQVDTVTYNLETTLPLMTAEQNYKNQLLEVQVDTATYNLATTLPAQTTLLGEQAQLTEAQALLADQQKLVAEKQVTLVSEQAEAQRAQTLNTRSDGTTAVAGVLGKQKDLYAQQITAYERDGQTKVAKLFSDAWITQKTIDEGITPPTAFGETSINTVLTNLKINAGLNTVIP